MDVGDIIVLCVFIIPLVGIIVGGIGYLLYSLAKEIYESLGICKLRSHPKIDFANFEVWYRLNPSGWELYEKSVCKRAVCVELRFSFIDTIIYRLWRRKNAKNKSIEQTNEEMVKVLESVRKDIEKFSLIDK